MKSDKTDPEAGFGNVTLIKRAHQINLPGCFPCEISTEITFKYLGHLFENAWSPVVHIHRPMRPSSRISQHTSQQHRQQPKPRCSSRPAGICAQQREEVTSGTQEKTGKSRKPRIASAHQYSSVSCAPPPPK